MEHKDIMQEIEDLKAQLQSLSAVPGPVAPQEQVADAEDEPGAWLRDLIMQAEDLIGGLDMHFKDVPAKTALVIFALGVLMGRMLARKG